MKEIIFWLILLIICIGVELITMGLTTIWFAGGALAAIFMAVIGAPIWLQATIFIVEKILPHLQTLRGRRQIHRHPRNPLHLPPSPPPPRPPVILTPLLHDTF